MNVVAAVNPQRTFNREKRKSEGSGQQQRERRKRQVNRRR
jgi:hypothetical protein